MVQLLENCDLPIDALHRRVVSHLVWIESGRRTSWKQKPQALLNLEMLRTKLQRLKCYLDMKTYLLFCGNEDPLLSIIKIEQNSKNAKSTTNFPESFPDNIFGFD